MGVVAREPMILLVLADAIPIARLMAVVPAGDTRIDVLAFSRAATLASEAVKALGARVHLVVPTADLMRDAVPVAREKFVAFGAEWSERPVVFGRSFREAFTRGGCSAWWFTELSHKNPGTRPTFATLCKLEALRLVLSRHPYERAVIVCSDRDQANVLTQACARAQVAVTLASRSTARSGDGFVKLLLGRAKRLGLDTAATLAVRWYQLPATIDLDHTRRTIAFNTWFPSLWRPWRGVLRDRYYVDLPDIVRRTTTWQPFYACMLPAPTLRAVRSNVKMAAERVRQEPNTWIFLERQTSVWDVCRSYGDVRSAIQYWWLERFDRSFRASFQWDDIDIFPVARHDLRSSIVRDLPYYGLAALRVRRMASHARPTDLVTTLETYPYGRAVISGVRAANAGTRVVGFQHSPVNANQLMYRFMPGEVAHMPLPDVFLLLGDDARHMLRRSGISDDRLLVTGARRFDDLAEFRRRRCEEFGELRRRWSADGRTRIVLVATNFWRGLSRRLVETCVRALADRPNTLVLVKPHPNDRVLDGDLPATSDTQARFRVVEDNLNELQAATDVMIGAFGTSDAEAIAIGCPVVRVAITDFDVSPTSDHPGATIEVTTAEELRSAVDRVLAGEDRRDAAAQFLERVFYRLDGRAGERMVAALAAFHADRAVSNC